LITALHTSPTEPHDLIRHVVRAFTDYIAQDRRDGKIMFVESQSVPELAQRGEQLVKEFTAPIAASLDRLSGDEKRDKVTTQLNSTAIFGALAFLYQHWLTGNSRISKSRIIEHVSLMIEAQVNVNSTPDPTQPPQARGCLTEADGHPSPARRHRAHLPRPRRPPEDRLTQ